MYFGSAVGCIPQTTAYTTLFRGGLSERVIESHAGRPSRRLCKGKPHVGHAAARRLWRENLCLPACSRPFGKCRIYGLLRECFELGPSQSTHPYGKVHILMAGYTSMWQKERPYSRGCAMVAQGWRAERLIWRGECGILGVCKRLRKMRGPRRLYEKIIDSLGYSGCSFAFRM